MQGGNKYQLITSSGAFVKPLTLMPRCLKCQRCTSRMPLQTIKQPAAHLTLLTFTISHLRVGEGSAFCKAQARSTSHTAPVRYIHATSVDPVEYAWGNCQSKSMLGRRTLWRQPSVGGGRTLDVHASFSDDSQTGWQAWSPDCGL